MPFTFAHVAAAPPLYRLAGRRLVLSALVVGAMSPDFEYFVRLRHIRTISHTPLGVVQMCLPASLAVLWGWHRFLGPVLAPLLPGRIRRAAARPFRWGPPSRFIVICGSVVLGAFSHLAWDAFTNEGSSLVRSHAWLRSPLWNGAGPPRYSVLWNASSAIGLVLTGSWLVSMAGVLRRRRKRIPVNRRLLLGRIGACVPVAAMATAAGVANARRLSIPGITRQDQLTAGVIGAIPGAAIGLVALALGLAAAARHPRDEGDESPHSGHALVP